MDELKIAPLNPCAEPLSKPLPAAPAAHSFRPPDSVEVFDLPHAGIPADPDTDPTNPPPNENSPDPELELLAQNPKTRSDHPWHKKPAPIKDSTEDKVASPDLFDTENLRSVINLLPPKMRLRVMAIPLELRHKTASQLQKLCNQRWTNITTLLLDKLRIGFWLEYTRVQEGHLPVMKLNNIYDGLCSGATFSDLEPLKLAYVLTPPTDYVISMETILHKSTALLEEALEYSPVQKVCRCHYFCQCKTAQRKKAHKCACKGARGCKCPSKVDAKLLGVLLEVHKTVEQRLKGAVVQRVKTENKNLNVNMNVDGRPEAHPAVTDEDIDRRLAELKAKPILQLPMAKVSAQVLPDTSEVVTPEVVDEIRT